MRLRLLKRKTAFRVHQMFGKVRQFLRFNIKHRHRAFTNADSPADGITYSPVITGFRLEAVNNQFYEMRLIAVKSLNTLQLQYLSVNTHFRVPAAAQLVKQLTVMALTATY